MKILYLTESFPPLAGGSGWSTFYLAKKMSEENKVLIAKINGKEKEYEDVKISPIKNKKDLQKIIKEFKPDLIHAQHRKSTILGVNMGVPIITTIRDYWHVSFDSTAFNPRLLKNYEKETHWTIIQGLIWGEFGMTWKILSPIIAPFLYLRTKKSINALKKCDGVICNSSFTYEITKNLVKNCEIIHNMLNIEDLKNVKAEKFNEKIVLFIGKATKSKGIDLILNSFKKFKGKTIIIGLKNEKIEGIEILPYQPNEKILSMIKGADCLVLPALWNEPLGRTHLECIGVGGIVVTTNTGGTKDIIKDGENGFIFDGSKTDLIKKVNYVLENKEKMKKIRENAIESAKKFDSNILKEKFQKFYESNQRKHF